MTTPNRLTRIWRSAWMTLALLGVIGILFSLLRRSPSAESGAGHQPAHDPVEAVTVPGPGLVAIAADSLIHKQLSLVTIERQRITFPLLTVSGSIVARVHKGDEGLEERWQFDRPELSEIYTDWLRAKTEIEFAESQLRKTQDLAAAQTSYLQATLHRLQPLMSSGSLPEKDFRQAQAELLKAQLQGDKDIYTAHSTLHLARKSRAALERQLMQSGIDPAVFGRAVEDMVLVIANVPEAKVALVQEGQSCEVQFYGFPDRTFPGHVESLSSTLTQDRRVLRVMFDLNDPTEVLKPAMFGEVNLGTDERDATLVPAEALLHIRRDDYVLVQERPDVWRVTEVELGAYREGKIEILRGLGKRQTLAGNGVILLKPAAIQALGTPRGTHP